MIAKSQINSEKPNLPLSLSLSMDKTKAGPQSETSETLAFSFS